MCPKVWKEEESQATIGFSSDSKEHSLCSILHKLWKLRKGVGSEDA